jgi:hypothetical protein
MDFKSSLNLEMLQRMSSLRWNNGFKRFEAFTAVTMKKAVFWAVALCTSCVNRRSGGKYRFHLQGRTIHERASCHRVSLVPRSQIFLPWRWKRSNSSQNVGSHKIYTAPHPRRRHSSLCSCLCDVKYQELQKRTEMVSHPENSSHTDQQFCQMLLK